MVLDEPTSALDVSVQSQVLNLLRHLQQKRNLTYLFITHNLAVVEYLADVVAVMESGRIVERGSVADVFDNPQQAYTRRLLDSIPSLDPASQKLLEDSPGKIALWNSEGCGAGCVPRCIRLRQTATQAQGRKTSVAGVIGIVGVGDGWPSSPSLTASAVLSLTNDGPPPIRHRMSIGSCDRKKFAQTLVRLRIVRKQRH